MAKILVVKANNVPEALDKIEQLVAAVTIVTLTPGTCRAYLTHSRYPELLTRFERLQGFRGSVHNKTTHFVIFNRGAETLLDELRHNERFEVL